MPLEPSTAQFKAMAADAGEPGEVVMLNLLAFRDEANYPDEFEAQPCSGAEAFGRYSALMQPLLDEAGAELVWLGRAAMTMIGPQEESSWDRVILVRYPSRAAFVAMVTGARYREVGVHRLAALSDARLVVCEPGL